MARPKGSKNHTHNWIPITNKTEIVLNHRCWFVCECGCYKIKKMKKKAW